MRTLRSLKRLQGSQAKYWLVWGVTTLQINSEIKSLLRNFLVSLFFHFYSENKFNNVIYLSVWDFYSESLSATVFWTETENWIGIKRNSSALGMKTILEEISWTLKRQSFSKLKACDKTLFAVRRSDFFRLLFSRGNEWIHSLMSQSRSTLAFIQFKLDRKSFNSLSNARVERSPPVRKLHAISLSINLAL